MTLCVCSASPKPIESFGLGARTLIGKNNQLGDDAILCRFELEKNDIVLDSVSFSICISNLNEDRQVCLIIFWYNESGLNSG